MLGKPSAGFAGGFFVVRMPKSGLLEAKPDTLEGEFQGNNFLVL